MDDLLVVTGDSSADNYAARLVESLKNKGYKGEIYAAAGSETQRAGAQLVENLVEHAVIGFAEVLGSLPYFFSVAAKIEKLIEEKKISTVVFMDFPGFNMRLAKRLKKYDIHLVYYITPQVWAWGEGRVSKLAEIFDELLVIFPFEEQFFKDRGVEAEFIGHPLWEEWENSEVVAARDVLKVDNERPILSFFPGSRRREVKRHLPVMLEAARVLEKKYPEWRIVFSAAPALGEEFLSKFFDEMDREKFYLWSGKSRPLLEDSDLTVLASGTVTMEAAFSHVPMIVGYRTSWLSYFLGRIVAKVDKAAMPNLIASNNLVPELIQTDFKTKNLLQIVSSYIENPEKREKQIKWLRKVTESFQGKLPTQELTRRIMERFEKNED